MTCHAARVVSALALAFSVALSPAGAEQAARPRGAEKAGPARPPAAPVIGCPSVANYRMLLHDGAAAAVATLADPKADHLGCSSLPRARIGAVVDRVTLAGRSYDCAAVQGTTACHWMAAGSLPGAGEEGWR